MHEGVYDAIYGRAQLHEDRYMPRALSHMHGTTTLTHASTGQPNQANMAKMKAAYDAGKAAAAAGSSKGGGTKRPAPPEGGKGGAGGGKKKQA